MILLALCIGAPCYLIYFKMVAQGDVSKYSLTNAFVAFFFLLIWLPSFYIYSDLPSPYADDFMLAVGLVPPISLIGLVCGRVITNCWSPIGVTSRARSSEQNKCDGNNSTWWYLLTLIATAIIVVMYLIESPVIPLFELMANRGQVLALEVMREDSLKELTTPFRSLYWFLRDSFYPLFILIGLGLYSAKRDKTTKFLFWIAIFIGVFYASLTLARLPSAIIIGLTIAYYHIYIKKLSGWLFIAGGLIVFAPMAIMMLISSDGQLGAVLITIFERIFLAPAGILYYYFEFIPYQHEFLQGRAMGKFAEVMGWESYNIANAVYLHIRPDGLESGSANAAFIGNLYADFGYFGIVFGSFIVALMAFCLDIMFLKLPKTPFVAASYIILMYEICLLSILPAQSTLVYSGAPLLVAVLVFQSLARSNWPDHDTQIRSGNH